MMMLAKGSSVLTASLHDRLDCAHVAGPESKLLLHHGVDSPIAGRVPDKVLLMPFQGFLHAVSFRSIWQAVLGYSAVHAEYALYKTR